jgi:hypothetical protein
VSWSFRWFWLCRRPSCHRAPRRGRHTIEVNDTGMAVDPSDHKCTLIEAIIAANTDTVS